MKATDLRGRRPSVAAAVRRLRQLADPEKATILQRFFKTGPGEYGEGDRFLGIRVPVVRRLSREFRDLSLPQIEKLLAEPWHEARLLALLVLDHRFERGTARERAAAYALYLRNTGRINNWDLVDASAPYIVGAYLYDRDRRPLRTLVRSKRLWERRIAVLATFYFIRKGALSDTLELATILLDDSHDLIHKAVGWMLREVGQRDRAVLAGFLDRHAHRMPRTMLRYSIEKLDPAVRRHYMRAAQRVT